MKKLKIIISVLLCLTIIFPTVGCKKKNTPATGDTGDGSHEPNIVFEETDIVIAENGQSEYTILIPSDNQSEAMKFAAREMKNYIQAATAAELEVATDDTAAETSGKYISLGNTALLRTAGVELDESVLGHDGYVIKRINNTVFIAGVYDSATTFGVWEFLHHEIDYEFYAEGCYTFKKVETLKLRDFDYVDVPDFYVRNMDGYMQSHADAAYRLRINTPKIASAYAYMEENNPYVASSSGHGLQYLLPPEKYYATHPEWYLAYERNHEFYNACLTGNGVVEAVLDSIKEYAAKNPKATMIDLTQGDGSGIWCSCAQCQAEIKQYKHSGYYVRFCNKVIEAVDKWREEENIERDFEYLMFTYQETNDPPVNSDGSLIDESCRANEKLYLYRTGGAFCYSHDFYDPECAVNAVKVKQIEQWSAVSNKSIIWDYGVHYGYYLFFFNDFSTIKDHAKFYKDTGAKYYSKELNSGADVMSFAALRSYLYAKFMWNVEYDTETLIADFMQNYYGDCVSYMTDALHLLRTYWALEDERSGHTLHQNVALGSKMQNLPKNILDEVDALMTRAIELCDDKIGFGTADEQNIFASIRKRILAERVCIRVQKLYNYNAYSYDLNTLPEYVAELKRDAAECNVVMFSQHTKLEDFLKDFENL